MISAGIIPGYWNICFFHNCDRLKFVATKSSSDFIVSTNSDRDHLFISQMLTRNRRYFNACPPTTRGRKHDNNLEFYLLSKTSTNGLGFRSWPVTGSWNENKENKLSLMFHSLLFFGWHNLRSISLWCREPPGGCLPEPGKPAFWKKKTVIIIKMDLPSAVMWPFRFLRTGI